MTLPVLVLTDHLIGPSYRRRLMDVTTFTAVLADHQIPMETWPEGDEGFEGLFREFTQGTCDLRILPNGRLVRRMRVARLHIIGRIRGVVHQLYEDHQICLVTGLERRRWVGKLPSETLEYGESPQDGFLRGLREELSLTLEQIVRASVLHLASRHLVEEAQGRSFPGLLTQYHIWDGYVMLHPRDVCPEGYTEEHGGRRTFFLWHPDVPSDASVAL